MPPASGVPVPQKMEGSSTSRSSVKYTGLPLEACTVSAKPFRSNLCRWVCSLANSNSYFFAGTDAELVDASVPNSFHA